jgi:hypothetical protein
MEKKKKKKKKKKRVGARQPMTKAPVGEGAGNREAWKELTQASIAYWYSKDIFAVATGSYSKILI